MKTIFSESEATSIGRHHLEHADPMVRAQAMALLLGDNADHRPIVKQAIIMRATADALDTIALGRLVAIGMSDTALATYDLRAATYAALCDAFGSGATSMLPTVETVLPKQIVEWWNNRSAEHKTVIDDGRMLSWITRAMTEREQSGSAYRRLISSCDLTSDHIAALGAGEPWPTVPQNQ